MYSRHRSTDRNADNKRRNHTRGNNHNPSNNPPDNSDRIMRSLEDRVMDDRNMNMTKHRRITDVDRLMLERNMSMEGTIERYGDNLRDNYDDDGNLKNTSNRANRSNIRGNIRGNVRSNRRRRNNNDNDSEDVDEYGEVTGMRLEKDSEIYDHGMPLRSSFKTRKSEHDQNEHMDFNLYDRENKSSLSKDRLYYTEMNDGMYSDISEAMNPITEGTDPYETCITGINTTSCWLNDNMGSTIPSSYGTSGYGLFSIMGAMYLLSDGDVMAEYVSYFEFQEKRKLNAGLLTIRDKLNKFRDQIIIDNYIITSYENVLDKKTASNIKRLGFVLVVNPLQPRIETQRINDIVHKLSGTPNIFSDRTISSIESISLVNIIRLKPIFKYGIQSIINHRFNKKYQKENISHRYLRFVGITCGFFEDKTLRLIEIPLKGNSHVFGVIMRKSNNDDYNYDGNGDYLDSELGNNRSKNLMGSIADVSKLSMCINYIEQRVLDEVLIPIIDTRFKVRLNGTLQNTGLKAVYSDPNYYKLHPDGANISDCIQYMDLIIDNNSIKAKSTNKGYISSSKFLANTDFDFYFRDIDTNTIFAMGRYSG